MKKWPLAVVVFALLVSSVVGTASVAASDQAVDGIYLSPASSSNGNEYASLDGNGELRIDVSNLNENAVTTIDSVFTISSTQDEDASVWVEPPSSDVTFYRMDTRASITSETSAVTLSDGETVTVGMRIDTSGSSLGGDSVTVKALIDDGSTPQPVRGGGGGVDAPGDGTSTPGTDTGGPDEPGTTAPGGQETPTDPGTDAPGETDAPPTDEETPSPEVGGFPWLPLLALLAAVVLLPLAFYAYRRLRPSTIRLAVAPESGLRVAPGTYPTDTYDVDDGVVSFAFEDTDRWADRDPDAPVDFDAFATLENTSAGSLSVLATVTEGSPDGVTVGASSGAGSDLLTDSLTLAPGESVTLSVVLSSAYDGGSVTVRCETHDEPPQ